MAQHDSLIRFLEKVPSVVTAASAGIGVFFAFDQNALAAWSAAIVCSGGVLANWLFGKYKELREVRRQQDNQDRAALVESIRDRIAAEIELATKVTQNSKELDDLRDRMEHWAHEADGRLKVIMKLMTEYEEFIRTKVEVCRDCSKVILSDQALPGA